MDWTFWVGGAVIVIAIVVTQVFLRESRWSKRPDHDDQAGNGSPGGAGGLGGDGDPGGGASPGDGPSGGGQP